MSPSNPSNTIGLALLALAGLATGFTIADASLSDDAGPALATLGPGADAFEVTLQQGETLTVLGPDEVTVRYAVFDQNDTLVAHPELAPGDTARFPIEEDGAWVLMRTTGPPAPIDINIEPESQASMDRVRSLPVQTHERVILEHDEGPLEDDAIVQLDRKPGLVHLDATGEANAFEARIETRNGPVFETGPASWNGTPELLTLPETRASVDAIEPGPYHVTARAEGFSGEIRLVHATYVRSMEAPWIAEDAPSSLHDKGIPVASLSQGEAVHVDAQRAGRIVLAAAADATATLVVYDERDHARTVLGLNEAEGYNWEFSEDEEPFDARALHVHPHSTHTIYLDQVSGEDEKVHVLLPGLRTAEPAPDASVSQARVTLDGGAVSTSEEHEVQTRIPGGLVGVTVDTDATSQGQNTVRVHGPLGLVYVQQEGTTLAGEPLERETATNQEHFTGGAFTIQVEEEYSVDATVEVTLSYYEPYEAG